MITNDVSGYINLLARIAHIVCNHPVGCPEWSSQDRAWWRAMILY